MKRLVDTFYKEVNRANGLHPDSIDDTSSPRRQIALLDAWRQKDLDYYDEGRGSVPGVINTGLEVRGGWYRCTADIVRTRWLHEKRSE